VGYSRVTDFAREILPEEIDSNLIANNPGFVEQRFNAPIVGFKGCKFQLARKDFG